MQLDVGMEPTFRFEHMICIRKEMGIVKFEILYFTRYELLSSLIFVTDRQMDRQMDRQTESDAYEPTVQFAQVGSKITADHTSYKFKASFVFKNRSCYIMEI